MGREIPYLTSFCSNKLTYVSNIVLIPFPFTRVILYFFFFIGLPEE